MRHRRGQWLLAKGALSWTRLAGCGLRRLAYGACELSVEASSTAESIGLQFQCAGDPHHAPLHITRGALPLVAGRARTESKRLEISPCVGASGHAPWRHSSTAIVYIGSGTPDVSGAACIADRPRGTPRRSPSHGPCACMMTCLGLVPRALEVCGQRCCGWGGWLGTAVGAVAGDVGAVHVRDTWRGIIVLEG